MNTTRDNPSTFGRSEGFWKVITNPDQLKREFVGQETITIATGCSKSFLGDGRDLREFLVASQAAEILRQVGHVVHFYVFDDNLDFLKPEHLRLAVNKNEAMIKKWAPYCGRPLCNIPSPLVDGESLSKTYQRLFLARLAKFGCHPNLTSSSVLYENGVYRPWVDHVLDNERELKSLLAMDFPGYSMHRIFCPICPVCGEIENTFLKNCNADEALVACFKCDSQFEIERANLKGKLGFKLDLALRWSAFKIDVEPFTVAYLEPKNGTCSVARSVAKNFFGYVKVQPIKIGSVKTESKSASPFLECLPEATINHLMTDKWVTDIKLTKDRIVAEASKTAVYESETFLNVVHRYVPIWALNPLQQSSEKFDLLQKARNFARHYLGENVGGDSLNLSLIEQSSPEELELIMTVARVAKGAKNAGFEYAMFDNQIKEVVSTSAASWTVVTKILRSVLGQGKGLPGRRLLFHLPIGTLESIEAAASWLQKARTVPVNPGSGNLY